jgi:GDP-L-fucose synthase
LAAGTVGGVLANQIRPAEFIFDNLQIAANVIDASHRTGVEKLLYVGSACAYPPAAAQPITEESLLSGPLEITNQWFAIAKIAGHKLCEAYRVQYGSDFVTAMPTNIFGPGDNYDLQMGHSVASLIRKAHEAKKHGKLSMEVWGNGEARRDFLFSDDAADALVHILKRYSSANPINIATGEDVSIKDLATTICSVVGYNGDISFNQKKPTGAVLRSLDITKLLRLGWRRQWTLSAALCKTYVEFKKTAASAILCRDGEDY